MTIADKLSILRIILIPAFLLFLFYSHDRSFLRYWAIGVFALAVLTDFFDGLAARIKNENSQFGMVLDPVADKLLMISAFLALYFLKFDIPLWVVLIAVSRDLLILIGMSVLSFLKVDILIAPTIWGKVTTGLQMATVLAVLLDLSLKHYIWSAAALATIISGVGYVKRAIQAVNAAENTQ